MLFGEVFAETINSACVRRVSGLLLFKWEYTFLWPNIYSLDNTVCRKK
jgi:hypothetical protein